jgi:hypothetical protein
MTTLTCVIFLAAMVSAQNDTLQGAAGQGRELRFKSLEERLADQIPALDDEAIEAREAASSEIKRLVLTDRDRGQAWLRNELFNRKDERTETASRLRAAYRGLPAFRMTLVLETPAKVGEKVDLAAKLTNLRDETVGIVDYRENSEYFDYYPFYRLTIQGAAGPAMIDEPEDPYCQPLHDHQFKELAAGDSHDPFAESRPPLLAEWRPSLPGLYTARLTVDYGAKGGVPFEGCDECGPFDESLLDAVPNQKVEAELVFEVLP